jgi:hypothetical protein
LSSKKAKGPGKPLAIYVYKLLFLCRAFLRHPLHG